MTQTRGERNNNPGNIRHGSNWQGLAARQPDADFCTFTDAKYGFRALAKILMLYQMRPGTPDVGLVGVDTVREIVYRWAPPNENNTDAYVAAVAGHMGVDPEVHIDTRVYSQLYPLVCAIVRHENGRNNYLRSTIDAGLALAGVHP